MINKWILNNFKSINEEKKLEFRPLTIFTGANSSGKSTILQSILLVTQTLQDSIPSRSIALNGRFKKFGSYTDIVNERDFNKIIEIGFSIADDTRYPRVMFSRRRFLLNENEKNDTFTAHCQFTITSDGEDENLKPSLVKTQISADTKSQKERFMDILIYRDEEKTDEEKDVISSIGSEYDINVFDYKIKTSNAKTGNFIGYNFAHKRIGVGLRHFLPQYTIGYTTYKEQVKKYLSHYLKSGSSYIDYELEKEEEKKLTAAVKDKALSIAANINSQKKFRPGTGFEHKYEQLTTGRFTLNKLRVLLRASALDADEMNKIVGQLQESVGDFSDKYVSDREPVFYYPSIDFIQSYFNDHIKYLGPLREEPKSLYPLETSTSSDDIGLKGENTAAVYQNNKTKIIPYIDPDDFESLKNGNAVIRKGTLAEAINKWLVYLGVASNMNTNDKGKTGHEMKIVTDLPDMEQDLTHVGVGVSQVLPILVMSFLADNGDVIILEQPELHLHPKVQTRLADFFVSMNALKKQCVLETHSEYLINRLRYLVAISETAKIADDTMIYFVEKEDGHSKYRPVTINKYGVIEDWPDGFFDESEKIAADILRAGMEKKLKEDGDDEDDE